MGTEGFHVAFAAPVLGTVVRHILVDVVGVHLHACFVVAGRSRFVESTAVVVEPIAVAGRAGRTEVVVMAQGCMVMFHRTDSTEEDCTCSIQAMIDGAVVAMMRNKVVEKDSGRPVRAGRIYPLSR